ncbi:DNA repair helicase XPB [Paenibacillus sp. 481]|uniref:DNA repair helicase XPB n=1 Tax=Paenibacillus sp. 481 TaxID=2835869 RepID=UPI001E434099|nr:DNA repair helicase XPB [Paenibacillus sp. 481]UHA75796.1 helicase-associated domain-containing protein [Paenibacillus sp. 481]
MNKAKLAQQQNQQEKQGLQELQGQQNQRNQSDQSAVFKKGNPSNKAAKPTKQVNRSSFTLIVQQDLSIVVHEQSAAYSTIRPQLQRFSTLAKSPAGLHTFRMTPLTLWNAAASGMAAAEVIAVLDEHASWPVPTRAKQEISMWMSRYGLFVLHGDEDEQLLRLQASDVNALERLLTDRDVGTLFSGKPNNGSVHIQAKHRGRLKRALAHAGYPVIDKVGYHDGQALTFVLDYGQQAGDAASESSPTFHMRDYQEAAVQAFIGSDERAGGDGVIVLPCGAGKTIVGIGAMAGLQSETLILTSNTTSVKQWKQEIIKRTSLSEQQVGEYTGQSKTVRPVTISTYQMMTHRKTTDSELEHMRLFHERDWGLIVYDEVHLLPAPVFRTTADLQATRRLGLTATLVREDGCERDVFSLIGPKRYELPWRQLEEAGWIAAVECIEMRVAMSEERMLQYMQAGEREKARLAGENERKLEAVQRMLDRHEDVPTLIIGSYINQLKYIATALQAPLLTGQTPQEERQQLYAAFKRGDVRVLVVSKVANFAVDLPDATLAVQVSGSFGSRQEEAQRLGRLLRPKEDGRKAYFYTLVSEDTKERDYAMKRQLFLIEQGYSYTIERE